MFTTYGIKSIQIIDTRYLFPDATLTLSNINGSGINTAGILAIEGPNEWDIYKPTYKSNAWPNSYLAYTKEIHDSLRGAPSGWSKTVPILMGGLAHPSNYTQINAAQTALGYNLSPLITHENWHFYQGGGVPLNQWSQWMAERNGVPGLASSGLWITETGWNTNGATGMAGQPGVSRLAFAKYLIRLFVDIYATYVVPGTIAIQGITSYDMYGPDGPTSAATPWPTALGKWSIIDQSNAPLTPYTAVQTFLALLSDPTGSTYTPGTLKYALVGAPASTVQLLLERSNGVFYLCCHLDVSSFNTSSQTDTPSSASVTLNFGTNITKVETFLPVASPSVQQTFTMTSSVPLTLSDSPLVIRITP